MSDQPKRWDSRAAVAFCVKAITAHKLTYPQYLKATAAKPSTPEENLAADLEEFQETSATILRRISEAAEEYYALTLEFRGLLPESEIPEAWPDVLTDELGDAIVRLLDSRAERELQFLPQVH